MNEAMIDIETLSTKTDAVVYQIAIVFFNEDGVLSKHEWDLAISEQVEEGRAIDNDTIKFHLTGEHVLDMLASIGSPDSCKIADVRDEVNELAAQRLPSYYWSRGSFDFPVLESLLKGDVPWKYHQIRDLRTLTSECDVKKEGQTAHTALADCMEQVRQLEECRKIIAPLSIGGLL